MFDRQRRVAFESTEQADYFDLYAKSPSAGKSGMKENERQKEGAFSPSIIPEFVTFQDELSPDTERVNLAFPGQKPITNNPNDPRNGNSPDDVIDNRENGHPVLLVSLRAVSTTTVA
ncbi:unnamed protein product [Phyllotreta striolata]|uniref:Uncharacterized protein n=1 Tax=Phyllotreta striolata TaxID=444603 RepID=A0A9N9XR00_PHYSR|nr:unnamed protein product [Phyllotreta striolata]